MTDDHKAYLEQIQKELFPHAPDKEQVTEFFEAVGIALTTWQGVEEALYRIFERAIASQRPGAVGCAFHALQWAGKVLVTDAAVRFAFLSANSEDEQERLKAQWKDIMDEARLRAGTRNDFAHFATFSYVQEKAKSRRVRLRPASFDYRFAAGLIKQREYKVSDIRNNVDLFRALVARLNAFVALIPLPRLRP